MIRREDRPMNNGISAFSLEARDEDYDTYLFWPSLSNRMGPPKESFVETYHRPMSPPFDHIDYSSGWDTVPSSPLSSTPPSDVDFPSPSGDATVDNGLPEVRPNGAQKKDSLPKYCRTFRMGRLLIRAARHLDRAVQSVGTTLRRDKRGGRAVEKARTFDC